MADNTGKQEVVVTDIRMRYGSMVVFMIKWAIASIPALIILIVLAAVCGGIAFRIIESRGEGALSWLNPESLPSAQGASSTSSEATPSDPAAEAYMSKVPVSHITVGNSVLGETGVFGEVTNTGDRTLKEVEITVYCLDSQGKPIFEKTYNPVLVSELSFDDSGKPLKPGYSRQFGVKMDDAPSEWNRKVDVKVTSIEFQ